MNETLIRSASSVRQKFSIEQFPRVPEEYVFDKESIHEVVTAGVGDSLGFGYDQQGDLIGWCNDDVYQLSLRDSIEFYAFMLGYSYLQHDGETTAPETFLRWLGHILSSLGSTFCAN